MSNVKFNPTEGENDKLVSVFSEINEGLDTTLNYTISDEGNKAKKSIVVNQVGKREKFLSKKGEGSEPFVLSDGNTFNVLKEGASGSASAWADSVASSRSHGISWRQKPSSFLGFLPYRYDSKYRRQGASGWKAS